MVAPIPDGKEGIESYSSTVKLFLHTRDTTYELSDVGPFDATLRSPSVLAEPQQNASLEIIIDGHSSSKTVNVSSSNAKGRIRFQ